MRLKKIQQNYKAETCLFENSSIMNEMKAVPAQNKMQSKKEWYGKSQYIPYRKTQVNPCRILIIIDQTADDEKNLYLSNIQDRLSLKQLTLGYNKEHNFFTWLLIVIPGQNS